MKRLFLKALGYRAISAALIAWLVGWQVALAVEAVKIPLYMIYDKLWEGVGDGTPQG